MNKTKLKIFSGAKEMFVENSFAGTALDTLLGHINVSKGSFFHHFKSKDEFLVQFIDFEANNLFEKLEEIFEYNGNWLSSLYEFINWRYENYQFTGRLISKLGTEVGANNPMVQRKIKKIYGEYLSYLVKILEKAKQSGQLVISTPIKELANFILYGLEGAYMAVTLTESDSQYADVVEMIKRVIRSYRNINFENEEYKFSQD